MAETHSNPEILLTQLFGPWPDLMATSQYWRAVEKWKSAMRHHCLYVTTEVLDLETGEPYPTEEAGGQTYTIVDGIPLLVSPSEH